MYLYTDIQDYDQCIETNLEIYRNIVHNLDTSITWISGSKNCDKSLA